MPEKLKNILFPLEKIQYFAKIIQETYPPFEAAKFIQSVHDEKWPMRELKEKMRHTTLCLHQYLPADFKKSVGILQALVPKVKGFEAIVLPDYVEVYGLEYKDISLPALGELTKCGSSEFAIRAFLNRNLGETMKYMEKFAENDDFRVRRFASEGCRPRLPWGAGVPALKKDPSPIFPVLEKLKDDPEIFVRKSVANNLNDISKDHPELVLEICQTWQGKSTRTDWIIKHACRTLLKQGNIKAMVLFGFADSENVEIKNLELSNPSPAIGDAIYFSFDLLFESLSTQKLRLEYNIHFVKSSGKILPKIFQISETQLQGGKFRIKKKHSFANLSTRKHFPGMHQLDIIVNGRVKLKMPFMLKED